MSRALFSNAKTGEHAVEEVVGVAASGEGGDLFRGLADQTGGNNPTCAGVGEKGQGLVAMAEGCHEDLTVARGDACACGVGGWGGVEEEGVEGVENGGEGGRVEGGDEKSRLHSIAVDGCRWLSMVVE